MIDTRAHKRRLSDADKNERITLRQMVLNMSMCKLQKRIGRKEPSLLRTVIINNTVQQIEKEMDKEMLAEYAESQYQYENDNVLMQVDTLFSYSDSTNHILHKTPVIDTKTSYTLEETQSPKKENKFGAIGDHRKTTISDTNSKPVGYLSGFMRDSLNLPPLNSTSGPILETVEIGHNFTDVDISLYDFDQNLIQGNMLYSIKDWQPLPRSCAFQYERCQPDSFFQELDQIMQVLVGM